jgi:hypothetical protein
MTLDFIPEQRQLHRMISLFQDYLRSDGIELPDPWVVNTFVDSRGRVQLEYWSEHPSVLAVVQSWEQLLQQRKLLRGKARFIDARKDYNNLRLQAEGLIADGERILAIAAA